MAAAPPPDDTQHQPTCFDDLDDGVVLRVMAHLDPLPDRFNACCCKRLRALNHDPRLWLTVTPTNGCLGTLKGNLQSTPTHATLADAVAASRPGDTVLLSPGVHDVQGVVVKWPLSIRGSGSCPEHTVLRCPRGADFAIDFFASSRLLNLAVVSVRSPAVVHSAGSLLLERCVLRCVTEGLDHLLTPLHTRATAALAATPTPSAAGQALDQSAAMAVLRASLQAMRDKGTVAAPPPVLVHGTHFVNRNQENDPPTLQQTVVAAGAGRLQVAECVLQGGLRAVHCAGSGSVTNVRVIQHTSASLFWFQVDSGGAPAGPPTPLLATQCHRKACWAASVDHDAGLEARAASHECVRRKRLRVE